MWFNYGSSIPSHICGTVAMTKFGLLYHNVSIMISACLSGCYKDLNVQKVFMSRLNEIVKLIYAFIYKMCKEYSICGLKFLLGSILIGMKVFLRYIQGSTECKPYKIGSRYICCVLVLAGLVLHSDGRPISSTEDTYVVHVFRKLTSEWSGFPNPELEFTCPKKDSVFNNTIDARNYKCEYWEKIVCMNSTSFGRVFFCIPKSTWCQEGIGWTVVSVDEEDVVVRESTCPKGTYQKGTSRCYNACENKHFDYEIPRQFKLYKKGDNRGPAVLTCNAAEGFYNPDNKSFITVDNSWFSGFCTHVDIVNPCVRGQMPLYNGTCLNVCSKAYMELVTDSRCKALSGNDKKRVPEATDKPSTYKTADNDAEVTTQNNNDQNVINDDDRIEDNIQHKKIGLDLPVSKIIALSIGLVVLIFGVGPAVLIAFNCLEEKKKNADDLKAGGPCGEELKKLDDNTIKQPILSSLNDNMKFVGALMINGEVGGTVFRVGSEYVMTAYHVIKPVIWDGSSKDIKEERLYGKNIFVNFNAAVGDCPRKRPHIKKISYINTELDIAILMLNTMSGVPGKMLLYRGDQPVAIEKVSVMGYGNPKHQVAKHFDPLCKVIPRNGTEIHNALEYYDNEKERFKALIPYHSEVVEEGYGNCTDNRFILFNGYMEHGASGAPLLVCNDPRNVYVVGVLTHGIPQFFYRLPEQKDFPPEYVFHKAAKMQLIYEDLKQCDQVLAEDIF